MTACTFIKTYSLMTVLFVMLWSLPSIIAQAQSAPSENGSSSLLLILDASGSMNSNDGSGQSKLAAAKQALYQMIDSLPEGSQVGLRVYGHRVSNSERDRAAGCRDTEAVVPVQSLNRQLMKNAISGFQAQGWTPIGMSLQAAEKDLPASGQRTIVLVSDGLDTCGSPDPCEVARDLARRGVSMKIHTIGFQVDAQAQAQLKCIAEATGGSYQDAENAMALSSQLKQISVRAFREYRITGKPVEGSPTYHNAPRLEPDTYIDTIVPGEYLWYGVELQAGQELIVTATVDRTQSPKKKNTWNSAFKVELINPSLGHITDNIKVQVQHRREFIASLVTRSRVVRESGTYYIRVHVMDYGNDGMLSEAPVELKVQVTDSPAPTEAAAVAKREPGEAKTGEKVETKSILSRLGNTLALIILGLVGLVVILGVLFFTVRRRRT